MSEKYYVLTSDGELYHYGVAGMKWGVRRDARLLANSRRNKRVQAAKKAYKAGKITKEARDTEIASAQAAKKTMLAETKDKFRKAGTKAEREQLRREIKNKTTDEVPNVTVKRGATVVNALFGTANAASVGLAATSVAIVNPAFAAAAVGAAAVGVAAEVGLRYTVQLGLDKLS